MPQRRAVQKLPALRPVGHVLVHERSEAFIVVPLDEVHQLMHHDVFQALRGLLG